MNELFTTLNLTSDVYSIQPGLDVALVRSGNERLMALSAHPGWAEIGEFEGDLTERDGRLFLTGPLSSRNAAGLRERIPWLRPRLLGLQRSVGLGDRLGLATPGHVRAVRKIGGVAPIFAQQSIREMNRSGRSAQQVMDDALWGILAEGWQIGFGADADHLKTVEDIDTCAAAGFTFYTIDPGDYVDNQAKEDDIDTLKRKAANINWSGLECSLQDTLKRYSGKSYKLKNLTVTLKEEALWRGMVKYGNAIAQVAHMYRYLHSKGIPFELEVSVDETDSPTTHAEHIWIANELHRLGVKWVSLAPRFVGKFEKGVEYIGDLYQLKADFAGHAEIARKFGPYKLSLHSGSDKFSTYPLLAEATQGIAHMKTAGTSYLEALRVIAVVAPALFREILELACHCYEDDRASYHVSARLERIPDGKSMKDEKLAGLLDQFDARQVLHVTFGSVLDKLGPQLKGALLEDSETYTETLERHFTRHLLLFSL